MDQVFVVKKRKIVVIPVRFNAKNGKFATFY